MRQLLREIKYYKHITIARKESRSGKLEGITKKMATRLSEIGQVPYIIIEADGAAHHSLKAPNDTEPIVPPNTSLVIAITGIDALGGRLEEKTVFRADAAAELLQVPQGTILSAELMATLIIHPRGILKGTPTTARVVPFINKVDLDNGLAKARKVACEILSSGNSKINTVLLGQVQCPDPVVEIVHKEEL